MLRSGLYGVLNHAMQASGNGSIFFLEIGNYNYRVEQKVDSTGDNYFIIHLPYSEHNKTLNLSHGEYRLNESHFTVYEAQGNEGGVYRPHFTGNYTDESKHQTLRLRGYVGDGDGVCIGNMRATTSKTSKKKGRTTTDIADFFDDALDKTRFKNHD